MELLPAISDLFGVTGDHLLSRNREEMRNELKCLTDQLKTAVSDRDTDTVTRIIRTVRRDLSKYGDFLFELQNISMEITNYNNEAPSAVLEEMRRYLEAVEQYAPEEKGRTVRCLAVIEDDAHIDAFIKQYSSHINMTTDGLMEIRYRLRGDQKNAAYMDQMNIYTTLVNLFSRTGCWNPIFSAENAWLCKPCLRFLHDLHSVTPDPAHPVSGNGIPDL